VMVLPGRNPVLLAKELATLDRLSGGRFLPAFGLGAVDPVEQQAFGVQRSDRAAWFDEALPLLRRLWTEDEVTHSGERFSLEGVTVLPRPVQQPLDVWLGGIAPAELRRVARHGDGWLPSFVTPGDVAAGREAIEAEAARLGRTMDPEHWGVLLTYATGELAPMWRDVFAQRRPGVDPRELVAVGPDALRNRIEAFCAVGFSKFVLLPVTAPAGAWDEELSSLAAAVLDLQGTRQRS
jgi:probable F420-dependent oxidoreductase